MGIDKDKPYNYDEAAELLGISRRTLQKHIRDGKLPARRLGRRVYIMGADLLNLPGYEPPRAKADDDGDTFRLGDLAVRVTGGNVTALAKMLNDAGAEPRLDDIAPDADARVARLTVIDLFAQRAGDSVGHRLRELLAETMR